MNLGQARTELLARGFDYLTPSRANQFLNDAQHEFNEFDGTVWPWLQLTTTGVAPLTISDVRQVLYVADATQLSELRSIDVRQLTTSDPGLTTSGTPSFYWLDNQTLRVYPLNTTDNLSVRYVKVAPDLSADGDTPLFPTRYHSTWVDLAEIRALEETGNYALAQSKRQAAEAHLRRVATNYLYRTLDGPFLMTATNNDC